MALPIPAADPSNPGPPAPPAGPACHRPGRWA